MSVDEWDETPVDEALERALAGDLPTDELDGTSVFIDRTGEGANPRGEDPAELYYGSVDEFVREQIVPVFRRRVGERASYRWAADWWRYPEAVIRLEALWRSWEALRLEPALGMSVWLRDHADHHLSVLMSPDGPFARSTAESRHGEPLPYEPPPQGLFPDVRLGAGVRRCIP